MSTKTTFKRIALATVATLGFGVLSVVPSHAAGMLADSLLNAADGTSVVASTATVGGTAPTAKLDGLVLLRAGLIQLLLLEQFFLFQQLQASTP